MEELFSSGVMTMGPSRTDPARQVGVFTAEVLARLPGIRAAEMEKIGWMAGEWQHQNHVPATPNITFDPFSKQWIYVLMRGAYGMLRSADGWQDKRLVFTGEMTMLGPPRMWRLTLTRQSQDEFRFVNEEREADGTWAYIDRWEFRRKE